MLHTVVTPGMDTLPQQSMLLSSSPICLLELCPTGQWQITAKAKQILQSLSGVQIKVISIVGTCRSGKSFLLNELFLKDRQLDEKFKVTDGIDPCTKGLWMQICQDKDKDSMMYVVIDSQGDGIGLDPNCVSSSLTAISVGISQVVLWNSIATITHTGINHLGEIAKRIGQANVRKEEELQEENKDHGLIWIIRDNCLEVSDKEGKNITDQVYLERCLEDRQEKGQMNSHSSVREYLKQFFCQRDCVRLVRAINEDMQKQLQLQQVECKLNTTGEVVQINSSDSVIREEFTVELAELKKKIEGQLNILGCYANGNAVIQEIAWVIKMVSVNRHTQIVSGSIGELQNVQKITESKGSNCMVLLDPQGDDEDDTNVRLGNSPCDNMISPFMEQYQLSRRDNKKKRIVVGGGELLLMHDHDDLSNDSLEIISNDEERQDSSSDLESLSSQEVMTPENNDNNMDVKYSIKVSMPSTAAAVDQVKKYPVLIGNYMEDNRICELKQEQHHNNRDIAGSSIGYGDQQNHHNGSIDSYLHTISELSAICEELSTSMSESKQRETQMLMQIQELQQLCMQAQQSKIEQQKAFEEEKNGMVKKFEEMRLAEADGFERLKEKIVLENEEKMKNLEMKKVLEMQRLEESQREQIQRIVKSNEEERMQERSAADGQVGCLRMQLQAVKIANQQLTENIAKSKHLSSCELLKQQSYNSELMNMISMQDAKLLTMQAKIATLKQAKKIVKFSAGFVCAKCGLFCETSNFHNHILVCDIKQTDMEIFGRNYAGQRQVQSVKGGGVGSSGSRRSGSMSDAMEASVKNKNKRIVERERSSFSKENYQRNQFSIQIPSASYYSQAKNNMSDGQQQKMKQYLNGFDAMMDDGLMILRGAKSCKNSSSCSNSSNSTGYGHHRPSNSLYEIYASQENKNMNSKIENNQPTRAFMNASCTSYIDQLTRPSTGSCVLGDDGSKDKEQLDHGGRRQQIGNGSREESNGDGLRKLEGKEAVVEQDVRGSQKEQSSLNGIKKDKDEEGKEQSSQILSASVDIMLSQQQRRNATVDVPPSSASHYSYSVNYPSYYGNNNTTTKQTHERLNKSINDILQVRSADLSNQTFSPAPSRQQHSQSTITTEEGYLQENNMLANRSSHEWNMSKGSQGSQYQYSYKGKGNIQKNGGRMSNKENSNDGLYGVVKQSNEKQMKSLTKNLIIACNASSINCHGNKEDIGKLSNKNSAASTCKSLKTEINERLRKKTGKSPVTRQSIMQKK